MVRVEQLVRVLAAVIVAFAFTFLINNFLTFSWQWPGAIELLAQQQWLGLGPLKQPLQDSALSLAWVQLFSYGAGILLVLVWVGFSSARSLRDDADLFSSLASYVVRSAFWAVLLIGLADATISFLRVEGLLSSWFGEQLSRDLARPQFRGQFVHIPILTLACVIAFFTRSLGFTWLAFLVVLAEFQIVISRFVFSYEQTFMGDLVRFWYSALFLFASAHTLVVDGHVRVDVLYSRFSDRAKAWANVGGILLLGLPLCWIILTMGMWSKASSINSPLLSFEISQSGYGMYVKYLMVGFLVVFALSMIIQFCSYLLSNVATLCDDTDQSKSMVDALS